MFPWLQQAVSIESPLPLHEVILRLVAAFFLGCIAALVYFLTMRKEGGRSEQSSMMATLVLLSVLISLVTVVINNDAARAFTLVGALAIVRFRTVVEDTRDTAFVIFAVAMGMAAGAGYFLAPLICTPLVLIAAWLFRPGRRPEPKREAILTLRLAAGRDANGRIRELLDHHLPGHRLTSLGTARGGSAMDLTYNGQLSGPEAAFALVAELSRLEGVQGVELKER